MVAAPPNRLRLVIAGVPLEMTRLSKIWLPSSQIKVRSFEKLSNLVCRIHYGKTQ
jgi:hypothetical protein